MTQSVCDNYTTKCSGGNDPCDISGVEAAIRKAKAVFERYGIKATEHRYWGDPGTVSLDDAAHELITVGQHGAYLPDDVMVAMSELQQAKDLILSAQFGEAEPPEFARVGVKIRVLRGALEAGERKLLELECNNDPCDPYHVPMEAAAKFRNKQNAIMRKNEAIKKKIESIANAETEAIPGDEPLAAFSRVILSSLGEYALMWQTPGRVTRTTAPTIIITTSTTHARSKEYKAPSRRASSSASGGGGDGGDDSGGSDPEPPASFVAPFPRNILSQNTHHAIVHGSQEGGRC